MGQGIMPNTVWESRGISLLKLSGNCVSRGHTYSLAHSDVTAESLLLKCRTYVLCQAMMRGDLDILQDWCHEAVCMQREMSFSKIRSRTELCITRVKVK